MDWCLAVDVGTSVLRAATEHDGHVEVRELPSGVCLDGDGELLTGPEGAEEAAVHPERAEPALLRALANGSHVRLDGRTFSSVELVAAVLRRAATEAATRLEGDGPQRVALTHPARWPVDGPAVARLREAGEQAGLTGTAVVATPVAAAHHHAAVPGGAASPGDAVAVLDLGAATFGSAVLRSRVGGFDLAGPAGGDDVGGDDLDVSFVKVLSEHAAAQDAPVWRRLWDGSLAASRQERLLLAREVVRAREALSHRTSVDVLVPGFDEALRVTRSEYEAAIAGTVERCVADLAMTVARAGTTPPALAAVYLVGGGCRTPSVTARVTDVLGRLAIMDDHPESAVVRGALAAVRAPGSSATNGGTVRIPLRPASSGSGRPWATGPAGGHMPGAATTRVRTAPRPGEAPSRPSRPSWSRAAPLPAPDGGVGSGGAVLAVTGSPGAGKTTLVNALLGAEVVPYRPLGDGLPVVISWGDLPEGLVFPTGDDQPSALPLAELTALNGRWTGLTPGGLGRVEVRYPSDLLRNGVRLVDGDPGRAATGRVHVLDATRDDGPTSTGVPDLLVLTKLDLVDESQRENRQREVLESWQASATEHVVVDAPRALRSLLRRHIGGWRSSGGATLFRAVRRLLEDR